MSYHASHTLQLKIMKLSWPKGHDQSFVILSPTLYRTFCFQDEQVATVSGGVPMRGKPDVEVATPNEPPPPYTAKMNEYEEVKPIQPPSYTPTAPPEKARESGIYLEVH